MVIVQDRPMFSHIIQKGLDESFPLMWLNIGLSRKMKELSVFWLFFKIDLCSAISFKRSR